LGIKDGFPFCELEVGWNPNKSCEAWSLQMTIEVDLTAVLSRDLSEPLSLAQKRALQRAVAKIVALGAQVGVSTDQMIELLKSGLTVGELLEYLSARVGVA
jgi:hypothetical protein